jgi:hypothetical protein
VLQAAPTKVLLALAEKWLDLADCARRLTKRFGARASTHPLVEANFAGEQPK